MAYGGITPVGLPASWPVLVDAAVAASELVVIGSGTRGSKLAVPGAVLAALPSAVVLEGLGSRSTAGRARTRLGSARVGPEQPAPGRRTSPPAPAPERAPDDSDVGWGERLTDPDDDDRRYLEDRPPHWGSD